MAEAANKVHKKLEQFAPYICIMLLLLLWELLCVTKVVPEYMLPSPLKVLRAFCSDFPLLMHIDEILNHGKVVNIPWKSFETSKC